MPPRSVVLALACAALAAAVPGASRALCTAAEIVALEGATCPAGNADCFISGHYTIDNGCLIDFGTRRVTLQSNGRFTIGGVLDRSNVGSAQLRSGNLTIHGTIDGVGRADGARGGLLRIETSGGFRVSDMGTIDVSGSRSAGEIIVSAGGAVLIQGALKAQNLNRDATGGTIQIIAGGDISATSVSVITAQGGINDDGGEIDFTAGGNLTVPSKLDADGLDGGFVCLQAGGKVTAGDIDASGAGDAGFGGCVDITAGAGLELQGDLIARGATGEFMTGGCGGLICLDGGLGDVTIAPTALINADGAPPDGGGGQLTILARGSALLNGPVHAVGPEGQTCGGDVCVETGYDVLISSTGRLDAHGGDSGGEIEVDAARNLTINGPPRPNPDASVDASSTSAGSLGGDITLHAGERTSGALTLNGVIDVGSNAPCDNFGCGEAGTTELRGCNLSVTAAGAVLARGPGGGQNLLVARDRLTVNGMVNADRTRNEETAGTNSFLHRADRPPLISFGSVAPAPLLHPLTTCPEEGETQPKCLNPCPVCGDGVVEFPEACDPDTLPPTSCGGCSIYCEVENCDDGRFCTGDSCNVTYGCMNHPTPLCIEPTATVTGTPPTPTVTPMPTLSDTATTTPSRTATPAATGTASATAVTTDTASATATETASVTATASGIATAHPPSCAGDCSGDGTVVVNELIIGVNIDLGNAAATTCPAFDRNGDGTVTISELIAAVNAALTGC